MRFPVRAALSAALLLLAAGAAAAGNAVDAVAPLNGTTAGEVPGGGRAACIGVLVPQGTTKGLLQLKLAKGSTLVPEIALVAPDGTSMDQAALAAAGAVVKVTPKGITVTNVPFPATGLWKVVVTGADGVSGAPTAGGFTLKVGGKAPKGIKPPAVALTNQADKDDYPLDVPENAYLTLTLKPDKATPFGVSLAILTNSGDSVPFTPWAKVGPDDSIAIKNMPMPNFGRFTLRVGSTAGAGTYALSAKVKAGKPVVIAGTPVADAGGNLVVEPSSSGNVLDGSGTTGATNYQWVLVSGPNLLLSSRTAAAPTFSAPATRATYAFQLVARNVTGAGLPSLAIVEIDRRPVADAGPSAVATGGTVTLDGTGSLDLDAADTLLYAWTQVSGPSATLDDPFDGTPSFTPTVAGTYVFSLVAHDGILPSAPALVQVALGSSATAADAGRPVVVRPQDSVYLSGLRSRRGDGTTPATFAWTAHPDNPVAVDLDGASGPVASFTAPKQPRRLRFRLSADGGTADEVEVVVTTATPANGSPVAKGDDLRFVAAGASFVLDGSRSADDGAIAAHEWMQSGGGHAGLDPSGATPGGDAPGSDDVLRFLLMVHDGRKYGAPDASLVVVGTPAAPVAVAGNDPSGDPGANLVLSSAGSQASPGESISSRQWVQLSGTDWYDVDAEDPGFDAAAASPQVAVPTDVSSLTPDRSLLFGLVAADPNGPSLQDLVTVRFTNLPKNAPPVVSASTPAATYRPAVVVSLNSSGTDGDGDPLSFSWSQISGPALAISGTTQQNATVTPGATTATYVFRVTVSDNTGEANGVATDDVTFTVNRPPVIAVSSTPSSGPAGTFVTLSGTGTTDPDDGALSYAWTEIPPAIGAPVTLSGAGTATATFTMPAYSGSANQRRRTFRLTVTDGMGAAHAVSQNVTFSPNQAPATPTINAAGDRKMFHSNSSQNVSDKTEILTAAAVTDADGDPLTFTWSVKSGPITTASTLLSSTSGSSITFLSAPLPTATQTNGGGVYTIAVVATDGVVLTGEGTIDLLVRPSFIYDIAPLMASTCGSGSCHGGGQGGLTIPASWSTGNAALVYTNLMNGRVTANDYQGSLLYSKITSTMPSTGGWGVDRAALVRNWIEPEHNVSPKPGLSSGAENN